MKSLLKIDEFALPDHPYLKIEDPCFYIAEYTSHRGYNHSDGNNLIQNLKKPMTRKGQSDWKWKEHAIEQIARALQNYIMPKLADIDNTSFVPIPPSKTKDHPEYDDRMLQILKKSGLNTDHICEIIRQIKSKPAAHVSETRPTPEELEENYALEMAQCKNLKDKIVLLDDVLTTGAHFVACRNVIQTAFPQKSVAGLFVARRIFDTTIDSDFPF